METPPVHAITPSPGTLIESSYENPDYRDTYLVPAAPGMTVEQFATSFFMAQPTWLVRISMNLRGGQNSSDRRQALAEERYAVGSAVGSWQVHGRSDQEIVFGEHMGFMEYRFSLFQRPDGDVEASTAVKYRKRLGPIYFTIVKPFHRRFVKILLANAASPANAASAADGATARELKDCEANQ